VETSKNPPACISATTDRDLAACIGQTGCRMTSGQ